MAARLSRAHTEPNHHERVAWEWVGPVGSTVVALGGLFVAWRSGDKQTTTALAVADRQIKGQAQNAAKERQHRLLEAAYVDLLHDLTVDYDWVRSVYPPVTMAEADYTMPPRPPVDRTRTLLTAYWSTEVRALVQDSQVKVGKVWQLGLVITRERVMRKNAQDEGNYHWTSGVDLNQLLADLPDHKQAALDADEPVRARIRVELFGEDTVTAVLSSSAPSAES